VLRVLGSCDADVYVLSEVPETADLDAALAAFGDGYSYVQTGELAVVARGALGQPCRLQDDIGVCAYSVVWGSAQGDCIIIVADLDSNLLLPRGPRLTELTSLIAVHQPDLVVGDLNAPRRSRALTRLPSGYVHAYDAVGVGWSYTWPLPCPVYAIDHCILGTRITPCNYDLQTSTRSDHRRQVLEFVLRTSDPDPAIGSGSM